MSEDLVDEYFLSAKVDIETERSGLLARFAQMLAAKREVRPMVIYYRGKDRILAITGRPTESEEEFYTSLQEMFFLLPSLRATTTIVGLPSQVQAVSGEMVDTIVTVVIDGNGAVSEGHVYTYDENDEFCWTDTALSDNAPMYSAYVDHMFPIFATAEKFPFHNTEVIDFLTVRQHEIEFFEKTYSSIDT